MVRIRRFGVVRTSNIVALWTLVVGLIFFIPIAVILAAAGDMTTTDQFGNQFTFNGGAAIIGVLIGIVFYAGFLWVFTAIGLLIYNLVAGLTGGVEMELYQPPPPAYVPGPAWGQPPAPPSGYGAAGGYQPPPTSGYQPAMPPPAQPPSYDPAPTVQQPTYDPAPRWEPPSSPPPEGDRRDDESRG